VIGSRFVVSAEYELIEKLGEGGMGEVYKARQRGPGGFSRIVVIKQILPDLVDDERFTEMFLSEAQLTARLQHPNIVQVLNLGHGPSGYFLAIEYVAGRPLSEVIAALGERQPPVGLGAFAVRDVCRALAYAYELPGDDGKPLQLVHRDVSPSNVMIGFDGVARLLDFGVAKSLGQARQRAPATEIGVVKGKLWYTAPERLASARFDQRADLFSAGVVLHEALTGARLFKGDGATEIAATMHQPIAPPSRSNPAVPPALDRICLRALELDPTKRFASGRQMAAALDQVLFELKWGASELATLMSALFPGAAVEAAAPATPRAPLESKSTTMPLEVPRRDSQATPATPATPTTPPTPTTPAAATFEDRTTAPFRPRPGAGDETDRQPILFTAGDTTGPTAPEPPRSIPIEIDLDDTTAARVAEPASAPSSDHEWTVDPAPPPTSGSNALTKPWSRGGRLLLVGALLLLAAVGALAATLLWPHR